MSYLLLSSLLTFCAIVVTTTKLGSQSKWSEKGLVLHSIGLYLLRQEKGMQLLIRISHGLKCCIWLYFHAFTGAIK